MRRMEVAPGAMGVAAIGFGGYFVCLRRVDSESGRAAEIWPGWGEILRR